jgi:hypothetical protein
LLATLSKSAKWYLQYEELGKSGGRSLLEAADIAVIIKRKLK